MIRYFVGIDPGLTGAVACYGEPEESASPRLLEVHDLPIAGGEINAAELADICRTIRNRYGGRPVTSLVEQPQQMGGVEGKVAKLERLFQRYGVIVGVLGAVGFGLEGISPSAWKNWHKITIPEGQRVGKTKHQIDKMRKELARRRASEVMPEGAPVWARVCHHGRAEAALLALMAARREGRG